MPSSICPPVGLKGLSPGGKPIAVGSPPEASKNPDTLGKSVKFLTVKPSNPCKIPLPAGIPKAPEKAPSNAPAILPISLPIFKNPLYRPVIVSAPKLTNG